MIEIRLSWPPRALWQNHRTHWSAEARAKRTARREAWALALPAKGIKRPYLRFAFHPPDKRSRDLQNMPATQKAAIDGIADALGIDDKHFLISWPLAFGDVVAGGAVVVTIDEAKNLDLRGVIR